MIKLEKRELFIDGKPNPVEYYLYRENRLEVILKEKDVKELKDFLSAH